MPRETVQAVTNESYGAFQSFISWADHQVMISLRRRPFNHHPVRLALAENVLPRLAAASWSRHVPISRVGVKFKGNPSCENLGLFHASIRVVHYG